MFEVKKLLKFQRPRPLEILVKYRKQQNNEKWSVDRVFNISKFLAGSCISFEINK